MKLKVKIKLIESEIIRNQESEIILYVGRNRQRNRKHIKSEIKRERKRECVCVVCVSERKRE